jgi:two-component system sensor histidine kinase DegS
MNQTDIQDIDVPEKSEAELMQEKIAEQLETAKQGYQEIVMLHEQSELEVNKLTQRNATATANLQKAQSQFERIPREEIRTAYDSALDAQQRLFVLRGQVEKLRSDKDHLQKEIELLEMIDNILSEEPVSINDPKGATATVELLELLVQAQEAERLRLSRQMHDGPAQALSNLILETEIAMRLFDVNKEQAYQELGTLRDSASKTFQQVRDFIFELRPMMLDDLGLVPTVKKYAEAIQDTSGTQIKFGVTGTERRMEPYLEVMIFRAVQELLRNALNHSQANQISVEMDVGESFVVVTVEDDGRGFEIQDLEQEQGMGLKVIKERVEMISGEFELASQIGEGTKVVFKVPETVL